MASLANIPIDRPLSRKGKARPMEPLGHSPEHYPGHSPGREGHAPGALTWHPLTMQRLHMTAPCGATPRAAELARSVARMRRQRVRISTRLEPELHYRLKTCAKSANRTQQSLVVEAIEAHLLHIDEAPQDFPQGLGDRRHPAAR